MNVLKKTPRAIRLLAQHGEKCFERKIVDGKYVAPLLSRRIANVFRKRAIAAGTYGSFDPVYGGWDPAWDTPRKIVSMRPHKGHIRERDRPERAEKITKAMEGMDARVEKYRQDVEARKPVKNLRYRLKQLESIARSKSKLQLER